MLESHFRWWGLFRHHVFLLLLRFFRRLAGREIISNLDLHFVLIISHLHDNFRESALFSILQVRVVLVAVAIRRVIKDVILAQEVVLVVHLDEFD